VWRLVVDEDDEEGGDAGRGRRDAPEGGTLRPLPEGPGPESQQRLLAETVRGVSEDLDALRFNTAIAKLMIFLRDGAKDAPLTRVSVETLLKLLAPLAPHLAEELWERLGHAESIAHAPWPTADPALLAAATITLAVQVNGKRRDEIQVPAGADEAAVRAAALASENVRRHLGDKQPRKVIVVPGRLVNLVV
jgi:leucyl-tRNA synthetase